MFIFEDRLGDRENLSIIPNETVAQILLRHNIPPSSVIVLHDKTPVADSQIINPDYNYLAKLIEGYDINSIRDIYREPSTNVSINANYIKQRLSFMKSGALKTEKAQFSLKELAEYVESSITETCLNSDIVNLGKNGVLVGLSGGVDSSSLLLALNAIKSNIPKLHLVAATFEDYDSKSSSAFQHASELASNLEIEHHIIPAGFAERIFNLNTALNEILPQLMNTPLAHYAMYIDHHTTRRVLEVFAIQQGISTIALGLHTSDLIAGLLNAWMTGYEVADLPVRRIGEIVYFYPLTFILKKELHLYHFYRTGEFAQHTRPNDWELNPKDRNFYYFLSDHLQTYWPGIEFMIFTAHNNRLQKHHPLRYNQCENCGASILQQPSTLTVKECDVCNILRTEGYIR